MFNWKEEETHTREKNGKRYVSIVCLVVYLELWVHSIRFDRWLFHTHTFAQLHITFVTFSFEKVCTFSFRWHLFSFRLFHTQKKNQLKKNRNENLNHCKTVSQLSVVLVDSHICLTKTLRFCAWIQWFHRPTKSFETRIERLVQYFYYYAVNSKNTQKKIHTQCNRSIQPRKQFCARTTNAQQ